jgi:hypothetical protein
MFLLIKVSGLSPSVKLVGGWNVYSFLYLGRRTARDYEVSSSSLLVNVGIGG